MTKMQLNILLWMFFLPIGLWAAEGDTLSLTLADAVTIGDSSGYSVLIASEQLAEAGGRNLEAWSGILPGVTLSGDYVNSNDPVSVFGLKLKQGVFSEADFAIHSLNHPDEFDNFTTRVQVKVPLVNLDAIFGKTAAGAMQQARAHSLERARQALTFQVKTAYYALILSNESLRAIDDAIETARAHRDNAQTAFEQGMVSRADYLAAEVRLAELSEQRIVAMNQIYQVSDGLKLLLGMSQEPRLLYPADTLTIPAPPALAPTGPEMLANRADLLALQSQTSAARRSLWASRGAWLPRLNAFGAHEWNSPDAFSQDASNWTVGVQLSWNIIDGFGHLGRVRQNSARLRQVKFQYQQAVHQARNQVAAAQRNLTAARQRIHVAQAAVQQAQESLNITRERFQEGLEKTADLLEKEVMRTRAQLRFLKARHDYNVALDELTFALGAA